MNTVSFISTWLKDIVVLFIIISMAELIMPKGNMKKYINMVIGLLIIFTIMSPIAKLFRMNINFDQMVFNYMKQNNMEDIKEGDLYIQQEKQIERIYKDKIAGEIAELIEENTDYTVIQVNVEIKTEKEIYGEIDYLEILIGEGISSTNKIQIEKVEIQKNIKKEEKNNEKYEELRKLISKSYLVDMDKIKIKWVEKGKGESNE